MKDARTVIISKDESVAEWQTKYNALYSAYEQLYDNYNITKAEYERTVSDVKTYEIK